MWWQAIPAGLVTTGAVFVPFLAAPIIHYLMTGRPSMRSLVEGNFIEGFATHGYRRDWTLCGNEYESRGLDYLLDEDSEAVS